LHFAHFKKRVERTDKLNYLLYLTYNREDETELLIRILSFGPFVEVLGPDSLREQIINRLKSQKSCGLF
ncbi:MAG: WYL domain-containing protein, partial [Oscillospiraceae bacterium]|nr:WYL domain-containing protein [Oscillospiraceae bacterium]